MGQMQIVICLNFLSRLKIWNNISNNHYSYIMKYKNNKCVKINNYAIIIMIGIIGITISGIKSYILYYAYVHVNTCVCTHICTYTSI